MKETKDCGFTGFKCGKIGTKCSECWLTEVWCGEAAEYFDDLIANNPPKVIVNMTQRGSGCKFIGHVDTLNM